MKWNYTGMTKAETRAATKEIKYNEQLSDYEKEFLELTDEEMKTMVDLMEDK